MTICLPFAGLLPHLVRAAAPAPVSERERPQRRALGRAGAAQFQKVPVDVAVRCRPRPWAPTA